MEPMLKETFITGDVVEFKHSNRIVLSAMKTENSFVLYHLFHPEYGVYTAEETELRYVAHLTEMDMMLEKLDNVGLKATA